MHSVSEIAPDHDRLRDDLAIAVERRDLHPFESMPKKRAVSGTERVFGSARNVEMNFGEGARAKACRPGCPAWSSTRAVREVSARAFDVDTSCASKVSFWPGRCSVALMPGASSPRKAWEHVHKNAHPVDVGDPGTWRAPCCPLR